MSRYTNELELAGDKYGEVFQRGNIGQGAVGGDKKIDAALRAAAESASEMKGVEGTKVMLRGINSEQARGCFVILAVHRLHQEFSQNGAHRDLPEKDRSAFPRQGPGSLLDPRHRNQLDQREFGDKNEPIRFAKNAVDVSAPGLGMVQLGQSAGVEKVAHGSAIAAGANDLIGERTRDAAEQFLGLLECGQAVQCGEFDAALRDVLVVDVVVERLDRNRDVLVFRQAKRCNRAENSVLVDRIDSRGHTSILSTSAMEGRTR